MTHTYKSHKQNEFVPLMIELIKLYEPHTYMEIGVQDGFTFNQIVSNAPPAVKRFVGIDIRLKSSVQ